MEKYQHPHPETNIVDDLFLNSPNYFPMTETSEPPVKENTLYLTIKQHLLVNTGVSLLCF